MNAFITGGAGYIGGTVAHLLMAAGHRVVVYDNLSHSQRLSVPAGSDFIEGEVGDRTKIEAALRSHRIDAVLHFAALIEAGESMQCPELYFSNNSASTLILFQAMLAAGVRRLVFSSTAAVYGQPERTPIEEDAPLRPTNPYGESKLLVEQMLAWLHRIHGFRYASLRYFNVAGAIAGRGESHEPESHLVPLILDVALGRRKSIRIYGTDYPTPDGTCIRDYIHVRDLAEAHLLALTALEQRDRMIYNLGNGQGFSVRQVIEAARRVTGHPIPVEEWPPRPGDPAILVASSQKINRELGWRPRSTGLDEIIADAWQWHQVRYRTGASISTR
ncbi:MAG: UDP-glucose 4-epimerase GalE [Acidobacteriaceae bacterium]